MSSKSTQLTYKFFEKKKWMDKIPVCKFYVHNILEHRELAECAFYKTKYHHRIRRYDDVAPYSNVGFFSYMHICRIHFGDEEVRAKSDHPKIHFSSDQFR